MDTQELLDEIYPILRTELEIIQLNGFILNNEELKIIDTSYSDKQFLIDYEAKFTQDAEMKLEKKYNTIYDMFNKRFSKQNSADTFVYYVDPRIEKGKKVNKSAIQQLVYLIGTTPADIVIITKTPLGSGAVDDLSKYNFRHFLFAELNYNIMKSIFSPVYEVLSDTERIEFLRINRMDNPEKLTKMKADDKISRFLNLRLGQIVRITARIIYYDSMVTKRMSYRIVTD